MSITEKAGWALSLVVGTPGTLLWLTTDDHDSLLGVATFILPVIVVGVLCLMAVDRLVQSRPSLQDLPVELPIDLPVDLPVEPDLAEPTELSA